MNLILSIQKNKNSSLKLGFIKSIVQGLSLILMIFGAGIRANSQTDQRIALAEKYFNAGEYYTAASFYEQYLNPTKKEIPKSNFPLNTRRYGQSGTGRNINTSDIVYKQAESYRLANYWTEAALGYKQCFEKDVTKYADALYWYAVCQRSLGNNEVAEEYINRFLNGTIADNYIKQQGENELETIQYIKKQITRPDTVLFHINKTHTSFGTEKGIFALNNISGNNFIFTSTATDSVIISGTSPYHSRLFQAVLNNGTLENVQPVTIDGIDARYSQGAGSISPDKKILYFTQWEKENGKNISSIYYAMREGSGWGKPMLLSSVNKVGYNSKQPFCSADGRTLFFASDMPGGSGKFDIWTATINEDGTASNSVNAGVVINSAEDEQAPFYHNVSGNLVFASNGWEGMGSFDLFTSKKNESSWDKPENMGYPVNSSRDDVYFFAKEEKELLKNAIISSDRGSECCLETYSVIKSPKKKRIAGIIRDCKDSEPLGDVEVTMTDVSGKNRKITTGPDGKFSFDLSGDINPQSFSITKGDYKDKTEIVSIESTNESDLLTDIYNNLPLCIYKIEKVEKELVIKAVNVVTVYFDFDKSNLKERETQIMDSIYQVLTENSSATIQISGYTDGLGTDEYNKKLSDRRARACADYLIRKGIESSRVTFVSFGKCCPVEMELINGRDNPDGRSKNRRALINISKE